MAARVLAPEWRHCKRRLPGLYRLVHHWQEEGLGGLLHPGASYRVAVKHLILVTWVVGAGSPRPWSDDRRMAGGETPPLLV